MATRKIAKKTSFVPRAVFRVAITGAGVIPFCVTASLTSLQPGCGGDQPAGVASNCFINGDCGAGVAASCFGDSAYKPSWCNNGVADATFSDVKPDREGGVADVGFGDVKPDHEGGMDVFLGVADVGFKDVSSG